MKTSTRWLFGGLSAATLIVALLVLTRLFVLNIYRVPTTGMFPSIKRDELVLGYRLAYRRPGDVSRGDIVFHRQVVGGKPQVHVKRVIALPGERVETVGHRVFINGVPLSLVPLREEPGFRIIQERNQSAVYETALSTNSPLLGRMPNVSVTVPNDSFFLLGDNRADSLDSRYTGCVPWPDVLGKIIW